METIAPGIVLYKDFFDDTSVLEKIKTQCHFDKFTINHKELCRLGSFEGLNGNEWLRCPSIEFQEIHCFSDVLLNLNKIVFDKTGLCTNIAKIQRYTSNSFIHSHSDKILDLEPGQPIVVARFGHTRTCVLTNKMSGKEIYVQVPNNSLLVISYDANLSWKHGIIKETTKDESYSIVFRKTITFKYEDYVYGKHTPFKTLDELKNALKTEITMWSPEMSKQELIKCFSIENNNIADLSIYKDVINNSIYA
jgi:hypothetical protein